MEGSAVVFQEYHLDSKHKLVDPIVMLVPARGEGCVFTIKQTNGPLDMS
eukprot:COSAG02_NODE_29335_length_571_cov_0.875000_2_plen_48_part_01